MEYPILLSQLSHQLHHVGVAGKPVVIKLLEPGSAHLETAGQTTDFVVRFADRHSNALPT